MRLVLRLVGWSRGDRDHRENDINERDQDGQIAAMLVPLDPFRLTAQNELTHHKLRKDQQGGQSSENQQEDFHRAIHSMVSEPAWPDSILFFIT